MSVMPIVLDKLINRMKEQGITSYTVRVKNLMGQATYKKLMSGGYIDLYTLEKLCGYFHCQPGDLLEYVPDEVPAEKE